MVARMRSIKLFTGCLVLVAARVAGAQMLPMALPAGSRHPMPAVAARIVGHTAQGRPADAHNLATTGIGAREANVFLERKEDAGTVPWDYRVLGEVELLSVKIDAYEKAAEGGRTAALDAVVAERAALAAVIAEVLSSLEK